MKEPIQEKPLGWNTDPQVLQARLFKNAVISGEPLFLVAKDILAGLYANPDNHIISPSIQVDRALLAAKAFMEEYEKHTG